MAKQPSQSYSTRTGTGYTVARIRPHNTLVIGGAAGDNIGLAVTQTAGEIVAALPKN